jgi:hypothetical protein
MKNRNQKYFTTIMSNLYQISFDYQYFQISKFIFSGGNSALKKQYKDITLLQYNNIYNQ